MHADKHAPDEAAAAKTLVKSDDSTQPSRTSFDDLILPIDFGRYRLVKLLGRGGMGSVYLAFDMELQRKVALKLPSFAKGESSDAIERFRREARLAATLDHANICRVYDIGEINGQLYLTMALVEGKTLAEVIKARKPVDPRTAAMLVRKLCLAVHYAHSNGIIHRDLKPANIMIKPDRDFVIMDFGLARKVEHDDRQLTATGAVLGTPAYMSPEQLRGDEVNTAADVYSLGIILYELLTGERPFSGTLPSIYAQVLSSESVSPAQRLQNLSPQLDAICRQATCRSLDQRYQTTEQFAASLANFLNSDLTSTRTTQSLELSKGLVPATLVEASEEAPAAPTVAGNRTYSEIYVALHHRNRIRRRRQIKVCLGVLGFAAMVALGVIITIYKKDGSKFVIEVPDKSIVVVEQGPTNEPESTRKLAQSSTERASISPLPLDAPLEMRAKRLEELGCRVVGDSSSGFFNVNIPSSIDNVHDCLALAASLPIRNLSIEKCIVDESDLRIIANLPLQELYMCACKGFSEDRLIEMLSKLTNLEVIELNQTAISDATVAALCKLQYLTRVSVGETRVSSEGVARLSESLTRLHHFELANLTTVTDETIERLSGIQNLTVLVLTGTHVSDRAIPHLLKLNRLEWLFIADTRITEEGLLRFLGHEKTKHNLARLGANKDSVTDKVCTMISQLENVSELALDDSRLTDHGLKELAKCRTLALVSIMNCRATANGVVQLRTALPNCKVFSSF